MSDAFHWPAFLSDFTGEAVPRGFSSTILQETSAGPVMVWERAASGPLVYLSAGIHGDEPAGPLALLQLLREGFYCSDIHWLVCPALNPEGLQSGKRTNDNGIDLNRDYFVKQSPESVAHVAWLDAIPTPALAVSLHEDWETSGFYLYEINLTGGPTAHAARILEAVAPWFPPEPGPEIDGHEIHAPGWIYHACEPDIPDGWPEAIYLAKKGCPLSFTFESPSSQSLPARVAALASAVRAACEKSFVASCAGPR